MSLRDTIEGALKEAEGNAAGRPKKEAAAVSGEDERKGFARSSAAKARPAREAAASVRSAGSSSLSTEAPETKEEKRARRERERSEGDLRNRAYDLVLRDMPEYRACEKTFWIVVGAGTVFAVASLVETYVFGQDVDLNTWQGILCVVTLVLAYVFIIGALVYDFAKRRPYRKQARARVNSLSEKHLLELFERDRAERESRRAGKGK